MKNQRILFGLILIIILGLNFQLEAANRPAPEELNSFVFYYHNGEKVNFDEVRCQILNCAYPQKVKKSQYETREEYEERKNKCSCPAKKCDDVTMLRDIYFLLPIESIKYDSDRFKFEMIADEGYKMYSSSTKIKPADISEMKKLYGTKLNENITAFMGVNPSDRKDYINRFGDPTYKYQRTYVDSFTRAYFTNVILDTRHDKVGSADEVITSIRFEADSPIEQARRLKTMQSNLVFKIHGDMIYQYAKTNGDLTRLRNVFYVDKIMLYNLDLNEALISANP